MHAPHGIISLRPQHANLSRPVTAPGTFPMDRNKLIFDIGTNKGEDALFYAQQGYQVIAVDADPALIAANKLEYALLKDQITFLNYAIATTDDETLDLYINADPGKTSLIEEIGGRQDALKEKIAVTTITLRTLIARYGVPFYCKIDIEGFDAVAVRSLLGNDVMPEYMSVETECLPHEERFSESGIYETLDVLKEAGYTKFKLVDQASLQVLSANSNYYRDSALLHHRIIRKLQRITGIFSPWYNNKKALEKQFGFPFVYSASGPFGEDTRGSWMSYESAKEAYLNQRRQYFSIGPNRRYSYWADWHAKR
jgi:FkbM family methyltransferase